MHRTPKFELKIILKISVKAIIRNLRNGDKQQKIQVWQMRHKLVKRQNQNGKNHFRKQYHQKCKHQAHRQRRQMFHIAHHLIGMSFIPYRLVNSHDTVWSFTTKDLLKVKLGPHKGHIILIVRKNGLSRVLFRNQA